MKRLLINAGSVLGSTILFVLILSFAGVLGPAATVAAATGLKIVGWLTLYILMVRIPIALIKANEIREMNKLRENFDNEAIKSLQRSSKIAKSDTVIIKKNTVDNPITPMPVDPDLE